MHEFTNLRRHEEKGGGFASHYRDLAVYRQSFLLSLEVHKASLDFPKLEYYALADQLRRSSKSVCANIVEGFGRQHSSRKDFQRFLGTAIGSCRETILWLEYAEALGYISHEKWKVWEDKYEKILQMLHMLKRS